MINRRVICQELYFFINSFKYKYLIFNKYYRWYRNNLCKRIVYRTGNTQNKLKILLGSIINERRSVKCSHCKKHLHYNVFNHSDYDYKINLGCEPYYKNGFYCMNYYEFKDGITCRTKEIKIQFPLEPFVNTDIVLCEECYNNWYNNVVKYHLKKYGIRK